MSRIGNRVLTVPAGVTVTNENGCITVKGPKGELSLALNPNLKVSVEGTEIKVERTYKQTIKPRKVEVLHTRWLRLFKFW